jgi:hypothetical protein
MSTVYLVTPHEQPSREAHVFETHEEARGFIANEGRTFNVYELPLAAEQDECAGGWYAEEDDVA